ERLFHVTADQVIGRDDHQLFPTAIADALQCNDLQVIRQGRSIEVEERILWRDRPYIYLTTKFPIRDASGQVTGVGSIAADITERKAAEQQRAVLEQQLRQAQRMEAIGHLTGGIAHDFNNLLTSMLGYTQMAEDLAQRQGDEQLERYLGRIRQSAEKARDLIRQMLVFSRGSRGQPRAVSLAALVEEFRPLLQSALPAGIELDLQLGTGLRPVRVDPLQLEQVLMNLCINARDAMGGSGSLAIRLGRRTQGDALCASCLQPVAGPF